MLLQRVPLKENGNLTRTILSLHLLGKQLIQESDHTIITLNEQSICNYSHWLR